MLVTRLLLLAQQKVFEGLMEHLIASEPPKKHLSFPLSPFPFFILLGLNWSESSALSRFVGYG